MPKAKAYPRKRFFIEMFTRDLTLSDCILDLIDNSIDGLIRTKQINLKETLLYDQDNQIDKDRKLPVIKLKLSNKEFNIIDNCGGIEYEHALDEVFNFGHKPDYHTNNSGVQLGVYGVGLKRAIFKIGDYFFIESHAIKNGFRTEVKSLNEWVKEDKTLEDWTFPIIKLEKAKSDTSAGTQLTIKNLHDEAKTSIDDPIFIPQLSNEVAKVYALFLEKYVRIMINGEIIYPIQIPFGESEEIKSAHKKFIINGVDVNLYASLAKRDERGQWKSELAGWYVACNGRIVVVANKDDLTGWGGGALPQFHSKYRGFVGLALFQSDDPYKLPWTTSKRGLYRESITYQKMRNEMRSISRPVLSFLDNMYPGDLKEELRQRDTANKIKEVDIRKISQREESNFEYKQEKKKSKRTTASIQYTVDKSDIEKVKKYLNDPQISNSDIGRRTFIEFMKKVNME